MINRCLTLLLCLLSSFCLLAYGCRINSHPETAVSLEVPGSYETEPEYISEWLDSIPYLTEHARYGKKWAYEALAQCYLYGKGGVERSYFNAMANIYLAGRTDESFMAEISQVNPNDPLIVFARMMDNLYNNDFEQIPSYIDALNATDYHSADILLKFINNSDSDRPKLGLEDVLKFASDPDTDTDAALLAYAGYYASNGKSVNLDLFWPCDHLCNKIPVFYSLYGKKKYEETIKDITSDGYAEETRAQDTQERRKAVEYIIRADQCGALTKEAAQWLHHYCFQDSTSGWVNFSEEDMARIKRIAGISE